MRLFLGEDFCEVRILLWNRRRVADGCFMRGREIFGERNDFIEMQDVELVIGVDFRRKTYFREWTWRRRVRRILGLRRLCFLNPLDRSNVRLCGF